MEAWRTNLAQAVLAKFYRVHQSTISRTVRLVTAVLAVELARLDPPVTVVPDTALIIDGTLIPTGNRRDVTGTRSGHRRRHGMTVHVAADLHGRVLAVSDHEPAALQDITAFRAWRLAEQLDRPQTLADKAYQGSRMTTPHKKPRTPTSPTPTCASSTDNCPRSAQPSNAASDTSRTGRSWPPATAAASPNSPHSSNSSSDSNAYEPPGRTIYA
ncbi:hypothetical protein GCM10010171_48230 [Actinokineospora fastidiosa]|uniref:Transposase IS4-like domain-containing protein n=1 Tax=Actinokineospora fastidiosa TaxID=1816 RepID=A0A918LGX0_9PSEU|nr:hypothetical protein GCM10010171_48230 [Actinokineospora fastidiosa]